jgi:hypothetical protein
MKVRAIGGRKFVAEINAPATWSQDAAQAHAAQRTETTKGTPVSFGMEAILARGREAIFSVEAFSEAIGGKNLPERKAIDDCIDAMHLLAHAIGVLRGKIVAGK